jgi:trafficking protein particle complex subunit 3
MWELPRDGRHDISGTSPSFRTDCHLTVSQVGFKMFLNITPTVTNWTADNKSFSLLFDENPLADFVELPDDGKSQDELWFSNILCGVLRGALEMARRLSRPPD